MSLESDLSRLIRDQFDNNGISFKRSMRLERLTARYFEMTTRLIQPVPRDVHFSDQIHTSLGALSREGENDSSARDAWGMVFGLRQHLVDGVNVNAFLSKNIRNADGWDGLLWTYGMHHFYLGRETGRDGFVKRSKYLLFAIVTPTDAHFVDVRPHPPRDGIGWVSQKLLQIVHASWPSLIEANILHGVSGDELTDEEMQELRRKNVNYPISIDGKAIAPLRGGMANDGSSVLCTQSAISLVEELRYHEQVLRNEEVRQAIAKDLRGKGHDVESTLEFELVILEESDPPPELIAALTADGCISRDLCLRGFVIVEQKSRSPIIIHDSGVAPKLGVSNGGPLGTTPIMVEGTLQGPTKSLQVYAGETKTPGYMKMPR